MTRMDKVQITISVILGAVLFQAPQTLAQENNTTAPDSLKKVELREVVISGTRYEIPVQQSGKSIFTITKKELKNSAGKSVSDLLNETPSLQMDGNFSKPGTNTAYYLRGGRNKHTLVLFDGIPVNDPSDISSSFDFRFVSPAQFDGIEILRGGVSSLYGSGASAGVISLTLKEHGSKKLEGSVNLNGGSFGTLEQSFTAGGKSGKISYLVSFSNLSTKGFSAAEDTNVNYSIVDSSFVNPVRTPFDEDRFSRQNGLLKLKYDLTNHFDLKLLAMTDNYKSDIDNDAFIDDENRSYNSDQLLIGLVPSYRYEKGKIRMTLSRNNVNRYDLNDSTEYKSSPPLFSYTSGFSDGAYHSGTNYLDINTVHHFSEKLTGLFGIGYQKQNYQSFSTRYAGWMSPRGGLPDGIDSVSRDTTWYEIYDPYFSLFINDSSGFGLHVGLRGNFHSQYGEHMVHTFNPSWLIRVSENIKVKLFAGTSGSFVSPTLYNIYSQYGNQDLRPEEAVTYEGGASVYINERVVINGARFKRNEDNTIIFAGSKYANGGKRTVKGFEVDGRWMYSEQLSVSYYYSNVTSDDTVSLQRIPKEKYGFSINFSPAKNAYLAFSYLHTGERDVMDWVAFKEITLLPFDLADLYFRYEIPAKKLSFFSSVNNLMNTKFVGVYGFTSRGRNVTFGAQYNF